MEGVEQGFPNLCHNPMTPLSKNPGGIAVVGRNSCPSFYTTRFSVAVQLAPRSK
jgi:hypothetical protein